ncbi:MAG: bifunctional DNA-formamidopyrimidine glycosylase/DNA-(apurinic or apyrimidinic site) lyase [Chloroflexi bacterium]|nr:bifunctional DNA-formamidopyrimidine glycosylase/DNA-(apurinic or apyrimidinic site) lyase [Chloroflexota bacterium]
MPELPEVETVVRGLREPLVGRRILAMWQDWRRSIHSPAPDEFAARVAGQVVRRLGRRGKYILIQLDHDTLAVHLKMTGRLYVAATDARHVADRWVHVRFDLDAGWQLRFSDARKFGRVYLTDDVAALLGHLGPEPLGDKFTIAGFCEGLRGRRLSIKARLLQQEFVAGVGNIYADEALFRAGIHPARPARSLTDDEAARLHDALRRALQKGIEHEGASINWYRKPDGGKGNSQHHFFVYGRPEQPCRTCGAPINKIRLAQRGTHFCPVCQPSSPEAQRAQRKM